MSAERSAELHERARAWVTSFREPPPPAPPSRGGEAEFVRDLLRYQFECNAHVRKLCERRGVRPDSPLDAFPAIPTAAFKLARISTFETEAHETVFRTSGTTIGDRGSHAFRDLRTYDLAATAFARRTLFEGLPERVPLAVFGPSPADLSDSSLMHMCGQFVRAFGTEGATAFVLQGDVFDLVTFDRIVSKAIVQNTPMVVLGTSFAFVHLLDELKDDIMPLPPGSRVMQTGGFKGKSREVPAKELSLQIAKLFAVSPENVVSEYGMTELSSQFYDEPCEGSSSGRAFREPPWARVVPVDEVTLLPVAVGDVGIARIEDFMNIDSTCVVLTEDRVRRLPGQPNRFELLGRKPGATPRGCSIAIDELLSDHT